tara:strand:+ start:14409 stop:15242 length:834 start_codon:yes stop_codon:yes gene_type:complete
MQTEKNELVVEAFLTNEDSVDIRNPIHSTDFANKYNFDGPLIAGVHVWGWATPLILNTLGQEWLEQGWAEFSFKQPTYPNDVLKIILAENNDDQGFDLTMMNQKNIACVVGKVGLGHATWIDEFLSSDPINDHHAMSDKLEITRDNLIANPNWIGISQDTNAKMARDFSLETQRNSDDIFVGDFPKLHPAWIAGWAENLMRHNFEVHHSIHTQSRIQFLKSISAGTTITGNAHFIDVYEKRGHQYVNFDVLLQDNFGEQVAKIRHWTIFKIAEPTSI